MGREKKYKCSENQESKLKKKLQPHYDSTDILTLSKMPRTYNLGRDYAHTMKLGTHKYNQGQGAFQDCEPPKKTQKVKPKGRHLLGNVRLKIMQIEWPLCPFKNN